MRILLITLLGISLAACAANPLIKPDNPHPEYDEVIARDAIEQLMKLYPPAKTQFNLIESNPVSFGALLTEKLRAKGYAVAEVKSEKTGIRAIFQSDNFSAVYPPKPAVPAAGAATQPQDGAKAAPGIELRYALVHFRSADFSRIALYPGKSILARAYLAGADGLAPAGAWTYKE
ncbi:hypothetical protein [Nitrosospira sp. Nsp13]|uniref:hypothetical protein n=1 Tax=Nitrosospira sp. Nsp13 TaxID=1855332 RepID=UPI00088592F3|nr:hypothetical protein [Nitrosospira sp. Nsp13]SCY53946.1 Conjugal transfer protein TrbH [Nitrosospira sp. Nsp13]